MKKSKRYDTSHLIEDQPEPGSRGVVLKNNLSIPQWTVIGNALLNISFFKPEGLSAYSRG